MGILPKLRYEYWGEGSMMTLAENKVIDLENREIYDRGMMHDINSLDKAKVLDDETDDFAGWWAQNQGRYA